MGVQRTTKRIEWNIVISSGEEFNFAFEPETSDSFSTVEIPQVIVSAEDFDGMIDELVKIRDEIRRITQNDAGIATGSQRTALTS